ncbi:MAG: MarR family winged helix-turn-helix transcriptional regulator [Syntrophomonadaceae bacterium]|jgi:DNA-binding MarR family transcriptional regulator
MNGNIVEIYEMLQEIARYFGNQSIDGECCEDLSLVEFLALKKAYEKNQCSIQQIGKALNFTKSGATRIIDRLETKGYVIRERSAIDGRVCCVPVTDKGAELVTRMIYKKANELDKMLKHLQPQQLDQIRETLQTLLELISRKELGHENIDK